MSRFMRDEFPHGVLTTLEDSPAHLMLHLLRLPINLLELPVAHCLPNLYFHIYQSEGKVTYLL